MVIKVKKISSLLKIMVMTLLPILNVTAQEKYHFVSIENLIEQEVGRLIIPKIYEKLNIDIKISPKPAKRAQAYATSGKSDGEIMRIWTYGIENKTTLRVPTPYYKLETMAFIKKDSNIIINNKEDLKKYNLLKVRGVKHTNNITVGLSKVINVQNTEAMMRFLQAGRGEVALTNTVDGLLVLEKLGYSNIVPIKKPLAVLELYHYIHEKNKHIISKVDNVIKQMKSNGNLQKIIDKAESTVLGK